MIKKLSYLVSFNTTGRTLKNQLNFKPGLTVIKGENEAGKSFVLEMIRYALFGSAALRGVKSDYDRLDVDLTITVKEKDYRIIRKGNKATVNINEAVGTTATNNFIAKLLGLDLDVFDVCANALQGELDKLTKDMKPTQRREMVDKVIGLVQFEEVEKWSRGEANNYRRLAESLEAQIIEPDEPEQPDDYEPSANLQARLDEEIRNETLRSSLTHMETPVMPDDPGVSLAVLHKDVVFREDKAIRSNLERQLAEFVEPNLPYSLEELEDYQQWHEQEALGPRPIGHNEADLQQWLNDYRTLAENSEPLRCPECDAIVEGKELPEEPVLTAEEISSELKAIRNWHGKTYNPDLEESPISLEQIKKAKQALREDASRQALLRQLQNLGPQPEDVSDELLVLEQYHKDMLVYETNLIHYQDYLQRKAEIDALPLPEPLLREKLDMALRYETLMQKYETTLEFQAEQQQKVEEAEATRDGYKKGSEALKKVRKEIKQYVIPALSKVSSQLLEEMTDGERRSIIIDEDFEIYVDKQHVRTLSGSGVSVVNLALRIALGQVLTQSVIPFFLADEIDANMAEKRTKATHDSLRKLKSRLKQIIVVTHKQFDESDETIWLKA